RGAGGVRLRPRKPRGGGGGQVGEKAAGRRGRARRGQAAGAGPRPPPQSAAPDRCPGLGHRAERPRRGVRAAAVLGGAPRGPPAAARGRALVIGCGLGGRAKPLTPRGCVGPAFPPGSSAKLSGGKAGPTPCGPPTSAQPSSQGGNNSGLLRRQAVFVEWKPFF